MKTVKITLEVPQEEADRLIEKYQKPKKPWRAEKAGTYWFIDRSGGFIDTMEDTHSVDGTHSLDDYRYQIGNYFQNKAQAEHYKKLQEAEGRIRLRAIELGGGEGVDWEDRSQVKYFPYYDHDIKTLRYGDGSWRQSLPYSYLHFLDKSSCKQLIEDCKDDLEFVFQNK